MDGPGSAHAGAGAPAAVHERGIDHHAATPALPDRKRQVAVIAVKEAIRLVETPTSSSTAPGHAQTHAVHRGDVDDVGAQVARAVQRVHDRAPDVTPVASQPPGPVEAGQPYTWLVERRAQPREPAGIAHLRVVVQEAQDVAAGQRRALVQRTDEADVLGVAVVAVRERQAGVAEEHVGAVRGGIVDDGQLEGLAGAAQAGQARAGERELIVDDEDDGDHNPADCSTGPGHRHP